MPEKFRLKSRRSRLAELASNSSVPDSEPKIESKISAPPKAHRMGSRALIPASQEPLSSQNMELSPPKRRPPRSIRQKRKKAEIPKKHKIDELQEKRNQPIRQPAQKTKFIDSSDEESHVKSKKKSTESNEDTPEIINPPLAESTPSISSEIIIRDDNISAKKETKSNKKGAKKKNEKKRPDLAMVRTQFLYHLRLDFFILKIELHRTRLFLSY